MKYLIQIIKQIVPKSVPKPTGRWNLEQCQTKTSHKVDWSNEDHCGPCGQYALQKIEAQKKFDTKIGKNKFEYPIPTLPSSLK